MEVDTQSAVLDEAEVTEALGSEETVTEEVTLPSDEVAFDMPDKFKGKSAEEIAKSYLELEKFKGKQEPEPTQEVEPEETTPTSIEEEAYNKYTESFEKNGALSEEEYAELAEAGYDRAVVDKEIEDYKELQEFNNYKQEKALSDVLAPLGGGTEKFKEVAQWANENKTPEEVKAFNEALAASPTIAKQALLRTLYAEYESGGMSDTILHTNTPQVAATKGYATESDFMKDLDNPAYKTDRSYVKAVEAKLARSNTNNWSF